MIIFLNGAGSSGKTSIAKSIQDLSDQLWLHIGIDSFIEMMPQKYFGSGEKASKGFQLVSNQIENYSLTTIHVGSYGKKISNIIPKVTKLMARERFNIILDEIILDDQEITNYALALEKFKVYFIGIYCDLKILEQREASRGDRTIGLARYQIDKVHKTTSSFYDLTIDTAKLSPIESAKEILRFIKNNPFPQGLRNYYQNVHQ